MRDETGSGSVDPLAEGWGPGARVGMASRVPKPDGAGGIKTRASFDLDPRRRGAQGWGVEGEALRRLGSLLGT